MNQKSMTHYLPLEFRSGNDIPVERATITRSRMLEIIAELLASGAKPSAPAQKEHEPAQQGDIVGWLRRRASWTMCSIPGKLAGEIADHIDQLASIHQDLASKDDLRLIGWMFFFEDGEPSQYFFTTDQAARHWLESDQCLWAGYIKPVYANIQE